MSDIAQQTKTTTTLNDVVKPVPEQTFTDRQHLIDTAVRFLQNPKVVPTSLDNKKLFLSKKGMTSSEIETALKRANCTDEPNSVKIYNDQATTVAPLANKSTVKPSLFSILIKWIKNFLIAGCVAFAAYKLLIKKYLMKKKKINLKKTELAEQLQESIKEMRNSLNTLRESVETINNSIKQIKNTPSTFDESNIRGELQSIKNLLLNRNQFPSLPTITPVIPSWQLESKNTKEKLSDENAKRDDSSNGSDEVKSSDGNLDS